MRKIKLELESLAVESFATSAVGGGQGTVVAQSLLSGERTCETRDPDLSLIRACITAFNCTVAIPCDATHLPEVCDNT